MKFLHGITISGNRPNKETGLVSALRQLRGDRFSSGEIVTIHPSDLEDMSVWDILEGLAQFTEGVMGDGAQFNVQQALDRLFPIFERCCGQRPAGDRLLWLSSGEEVLRRIASFGAGVSPVIDSDDNSLIPLGMAEGKVYVLAT